MTDLVQHHVKYKEIHGVDEIVMMTPSEHKLLHIKLRKEGKCNVPADELKKISEKAHERTPKSKMRALRYFRSKNGKVQKNKYEESDAGRLTAAKHVVDMFTKNFSKSFGNGISLDERIRCNLKTGSIGYTANFRVRQGHTLPVIDIGTN